MNLESLGWSNQLELPQGDTPVRVVAIYRSHLRAAGEDGEINLYRSGQLIEDVAVGDWVTITPPFIDEQNQPAALIKELIERQSSISRSHHGREQVLAANVDTVFIVTSANFDLNINRIQRFLVLVNEGGAQPVVILSKVDLIEDHQMRCEELANHLGVPVLPTSLSNDTGLNDLRDMIPTGQTAVFVGSSGVGKSSLVNHLLGQDIQKIQDIREDDSKGRHTTTGRQLFVIDERGIIIDSPGIREVEVFGSSESLQQTFPQIQELETRCRFSNCRHRSEPGCAVQAALNSGELGIKDWNNYQKLQREMAYSNRKMDKVAQSNSKQKWKRITTDMRRKRKLEGR